MCTTLIFLPHHLVTFLKNRFVFIDIALEEFRGGAEENFEKNVLLQNKIIKVDKTKKKGKENIRKQLIIVTPT